MISSPHLYKETVGYMDLNRLYTKNPCIKDEVSKLFEISAYLDEVSDSLLGQAEKVAKRSRNKINRKKLMALIDDAMSIDKKLRHLQDMYGEDATIEYIQEASESLSNALLLLNHAFNIATK